MAKRAKWQLGQPGMSVGGDGAATLTVTLFDGKSKQGDLSFTMTADRVLEVTWRAESGADGLADFRAWSTT